MVIEQTVDIPEDRHLRLEFDLPESVRGRKAAVRVRVDTEQPRSIPLLFWFLNRREARFRKAVSKFAGCLVNSPAFEGDPVEVQRKMRSEWDRPWDTDEA